jgi:hypothetical protein
MQLVGNARRPAAVRLRLFCMFCIAVLAVYVPAAAQTPTVELTGMWKATVGNGPVMQGMWLAQISKASPNAASGSWSLLSDGGEIVLQGTWSARKTGQSWQGSWRARVGNGRSLSGTWSAALSESKGQTFQEMLALTMQKQIGGAWQSGPYQGNWWLEGPSPKRRK